MVEEISLDATRGTIEFMCCANASRPLKPVRTQRSTVTVKDVDEISILVSVVRAYDVPVRRDLEQGGSVVAGSGESVRVASAGGGGAGAGQGGPREAMVHSYIEARFQVSSIPYSLLILEKDESWVKHAPTELTECSMLNLPLSTGS